MPRLHPDLLTRHFLAGTAARFLLDLQRSDGSIRLAFYDFGYLDRPYVEYAGDVADGEVSAASPVETGHIVCSGVRFDYAAEGRVRGHFSESGRSLMAEEVFVLRLTSGETLTFAYEWSATQP